MKKKSLKQTVIASWVSVAVCLVAIVGLAFAFLMDKQNQEVPVNTVKAGEMLVDMVDSSGETLTGKTLVWMTDEVNCWEPGKTIYSEPFTIMNNGDLYFKYRLTIAGIDKSNKLAGVMDFHIYSYDAKKGKVDTSRAYEGKDFMCETLGKAETFVIGATMSNVANNSYQGTRLGNLSVVLQAAQTESDGVYEKVTLKNVNNVDITKATKVKNYKELSTAIAQATENSPVVIEITDNIVVSESLVINKPVRIYSFGGHKITLNTEKTLFDITETGSLYVEGVTLKSAVNTGSVYIKAAGDLTLESCEVVDVKALNSTESKDYNLIEGFGKANMTFVNTRFSRCITNRLIKDNAERIEGATVEMRNCTVLNSTARVMIEVKSTFKVAGGTFSGNETGTRSGGSLFFVAKSSAAKLTLKSVTIKNNVTVSKQAAVAWVQRGAALYIEGNTLIENNTASLSYGNIKSSGGYLRINSGTIKPITSNGEIVEKGDHYTGVVKAGGTVLIGKKAKIEGTSLGIE